MRLPPPFSARVLIILALLCLVPGFVQAAGMSTHAAMADFGRQALPEGPLKMLLTRHRASLVAGALNPDGGYGTGAAFPEDRGMAEGSHWGDFTKAFIRYLRETKDGGRCAREARTFQATTLAQTPAAMGNPFKFSDDCGRLIAFFFGNAAHGITDETWDILFEPQVRARGEDPNPATLLAMVPWGNQLSALSQLFAATPLNAIEYAGDVVGIAEYGLFAEAPILENPPTQDLVAVWASFKPNPYTGSNTVAAEAIERAHLLARGAVAAERSGAAAEIVRLRATMPWLVANYMAGPGGVVDSGYMVSAMYQQWWELITAENPAQIRTPFVGGVYPKNAARDVPLNLRDDRTGLDPAGTDGRDRFRVVAVMGRNVLPTSANEKTVLMFDEAGKAVPGNVSVGIYNRDFTHLVRFAPRTPLKAGHTYTMVLTTGLKDVDGQPLAKAYSWRFQTAVQ